MVSGIELCTSCTLQGRSDRCATSVNTLVTVCNLYPTRHKSSNLLVKSHLVAGVECPAPACATRSSHAFAGPGRNLDFAVAKLGLDSEALLESCNAATYSHLIEK
jgi:hypothetical protein